MKEEVLTNKTFWGKFFRYFFLFSALLVVILVGQSMLLDSQSPDTANAEELIFLEEFTNISGGPTQGDGGPSQGNGGPTQGDGGPTQGPPPDKPPQSAPPQVTPPSQDKPPQGSPPDDKPPHVPSCPQREEKYPQCGGTVGLENYPATDTIEVTRVLDCHGNIIRYDHKNLGNLGQCQQPPTQTPQPTPPHITMASPTPTLTPPPVVTPPPTQVSCPVNNSCCAPGPIACTSNGLDTKGECPEPFKWCYAGTCVHRDFNPATNTCVAQVTPTPMPTPTPTAGVPTPVPTTPTITTQAPVNVSAVSNATSTSTSTATGGAGGSANVTVTQTATQPQGAPQQVVQPVPGQKVAVGQAKELPRTGIPLAAWAAAAFLPLGFKLRHFYKGVDSQDEKPLFINQKRRFDKDNK